MTHQRCASGVVQNFGFSGFHAGTFSRGEYENVKVFHTESARTRSLPAGRDHGESLRLPTANPDRRIPVPSIGDTPGQSLQILHPRPRIWRAAMAKAFRYSEQFLRITAGRRNDSPM